MAKEAKNKQFYNATEVERNLRLAYIKHFDQNLRQSNIDVEHVLRKTIEYSAARIRIEEDHFCAANSSKDHVMQID